MKNILAAKDLQGEALDYITRTYGAEVAWHFPNLPAELVSKLLSGFTEAMIEEHLLVHFGLTKPVPAKAKRKR